MKIRKEIIKVLNIVLIINIKALNINIKRIKTKLL